MILGAFSFIYDVFWVSVEAKDVIKDQVCGRVYPMSLGWSDLCCMRLRSLRMKLTFEFR